MDAPAPTRPTLLPGTRTERTTFLLLLALAALLRCWDLAHMPYSHDEVSALTRIFPSLQETVRVGVMEQDTHPPGVQVFEWLWTRLFGMQEWVVKLPFIVMSLAAIALLYRFAYAWCGGTVALLGTVLFATLQYTVLYGQLARPYAAGLFTVALLADQLTVFQRTGTRRSLIMAVVAAVLSAYVHHFALLVAGLLYLTWLAWSTGNQRRQLLVGAAIGALCYAPNILITLRQLGMGGLQDWLHAPGATWPLAYAWWLAHCSWWFAAVWVALLIGSILGRTKGSGAPRLWVLALVVGLLPLLIGFGYSVWRAPVLQYSVVLFSFPFLLLPALSGWKYLPSTWGRGATISTALIATITLITTRAHFRTAYDSPYVAITKGILAGPAAGHTSVVHIDPRMLSFHLQHWGVTEVPPYLNLFGHTAHQTDSLLDHVEGLAVFLGITASAVPEVPALVRARFPFLQARHDMVEGQTFRFSAIPAGSAIDDHTFHSLITPHALRGEGWNVDGSVPVRRDTTTSYPVPPHWDLTGRPFGIVFEGTLDSLGAGGNDVIEAVADVSGAGLRLVAELRQADSTLFYRFGESRAGEHQRAVVALKLADIAAPPDAQLKVYVWNHAEGPVEVRAVEVQVRAGDPWLYGLYEPLRGPRRYQ